jgi:hypothetical protein
MSPRTRPGAVIAKEDRHNNHKIDLAAAAVLAFGRAAVAEPAPGIWIA